MLYRRLLTGNTGLPVPPPPPVNVVTLAASPHGSFNWDERTNALQVGGKSFWAVNNGSSGDVEVYERDETTGAVTGPTVLRAAMQKDAHAVPTLAVRSSDNKLVACYAPHVSGSGAVYRRISTNALDSTAWAAETNIRSQLTGTNTTDISLHQLNAEVGAPIYMVWRNVPSGFDSRWVLSKSTDGGSTWTSLINMYWLGAVRSYVHSASNEQDRIDCIATSTFDFVHPNAIGHFYYQGGNFYKSDGTFINSTGITSFAQITEIYPSTTIANPGAVAYDGSGNPVVTFYTWNAATKLYTYWYTRWTGSAWTTRTAFVTDTPSLNWNPSAHDGMYLAAVDDADVSTIYSVEVVAGQAEVYRYVTHDGGSTFSRAQMTSGSSGFQGFIIPVRNRATSAGALVAAYTFGTWNHYSSYALGTKGLVLP